MKNYWFIADTHFNHKTILNFKNSEGKPLRPFSNLEEMNETIIDNWNKLVKPQDKIYHLGDVIFGNHIEYNNILKRLNGKKRLILGNHDCNKERFLIPYFQKMHGVRHLNIEGNSLILSHIPIHIDSLKRFRLNIHGHCHDSHVKEAREECSYVNVCVENTNYKPVNLEEIINNSF